MISVSVVSMMMTVTVIMMMSLKSTWKVFILEGGESHECVTVF